MDQIEQTMCKQMTDDIAILETIEECAKKSQAHLRMVTTKCAYKLYIYIYIYMYKEDLALNNLQWLICHKNKPNQIIYI